MAPRQRGRPLAHHCFCPACGGLVLMRSEAAPDMLAVPVGGFAVPATAYWTSRKPDWCALSGVREIARQ